MAATTAFKDQILALLETGHYLSLLTAVADEAAGTVTECALSGYARQAISWTAKSGGAFSNSAAITFPDPTGSATITHAGIHSALTGGTLKFVFPISPSKTYAASSVIEIPIGDLDFDANRINT